MLASGWHAHMLNAPGKFLVAAGHDTPNRARAYLITDQAVATTAATYAGFRPPRPSTRSRSKPSTKTTGQNDPSPGSCPPPSRSLTTKTPTRRPRSSSGPCWCSPHPKEPRCPASWPRPVRVARGCTSACASSPTVAKSSKSVADGGEPPPVTPPDCLRLLVYARLHVMVGTAVLDEDVDNYPTQRPQGAARRSPAHDPTEVMPQCRPTPSKQVAKMLNISRDKVYYLLRTRQLRSIKIGKSRRITDAHPAAFLASLEADDAA
jgi:excisionase family DNA binding protein